MRRSQNLCCPFSVPSRRLCVASVHEGKRPQDSKKPFKCDICNSAFTWKSNLKTHSASVHDGKKVFDCDICDTTFTIEEIFKGTCSS